jgi:hypothetical protein
MKVMKGNIRFWPRRAPGRDGTLDNSLTINITPIQYDAKYRYYGETFHKSSRGSFASGWPGRLPQWPGLMCKYDVKFSNRAIYVSKSSASRRAWATVPVTGAAQSARFALA